MIALKYVYWHSRWKCWQSLRMYKINGKYKLIWGGYGKTKSEAYEKL